MRESKLSTSIRAKYKEFETQLSNLGFSAYESAVYLTLIQYNKPAKVTEIERDCKDTGRPVPAAKIYSVLSNMERLGLVERIDKPLSYSARFDKGHIKEYLKNKSAEAQGKIEEETTNKIIKLDHIWKESLSTLREDVDIWRVYSKEEAKQMSLSMCKNATREIRLMTEHGGWIHNDPEFRSVLIDKSQDKKFKIWALLAKESSVKKGRKDEWNAFREFLDKYNIRYYFYEPRALRMTLADRKESLFFMYRDQEQKEDPIIYYTSIRDVSHSLAEFFNMECLFEYNNKLKSFIKSNTKDKKFCDLQNLLFDKPQEPL